MTRPHPEIRADLPAGLHFTPMPSDDDLRKRALARTDQELLDGLEEVVRDTRRRLLEGGTSEQRERLELQLGAAKRARDRIKRRLR